MREFDFILRYLISIFFVFIFLLSFLVYKFFSFFFIKMIKEFYVTVVIVNIFRPIFFFNIEVKVD